MSLSSTITLPSSSTKALYSYGRTALPRASSPATSNYTLSPPVSPPGSPPPSMMITLPASSANGFYLSWKHRAEIPSPTGSGSLSPAMSRPSSPLPLPLPLQTISQVFGQRASWPVSHPIAERQISESTSDSRPTSLSTSVSYAYTVKSINSRKSRLTVLYPRPVRPQRVSGVDSIPESEGTSLESLIALSSRPVSMSMPPPENLTPVADTEHIADVMGSLAKLFEPSPESAFPVERCLLASWDSLLRIKAYEEKHAIPSLRTTRIYADTLLCVHNEIVERHVVGAQELIRPCYGLNEAFEDAYVLLSNSGTIPQAPEHIPALDADLFKNSVVTIKQLIELIRALEVLLDSLAILTVVGASSVARKAGLDDGDVIFNVPGWRHRRESRPTLPSAAGTAPVLAEGAVDSTLRVLLVTRNEELEGELRGLRFLLWRASPRAKAKLGNIVKLTLPLHHEELMKSPVEDFIGHWQATVVPPPRGIDDRIMERDDADF